MARQKIMAIGSAMCFFALTLLLIDPLIQTGVKRLWLTPGVTEAAGSSPTSDYFEGSILQRQALASTDILPLYGSSEMSLINDFHPAKVFDGKPTHFAPFLVGRGGTQTLIHVLNMAALGESLRDKKVVIFLTPQWYGPGGIPQSTFAGNFSALHAYQMLFNPSISLPTKQAIAKRLLQFPDALKEYPILAQMLQLYGQAGWKSRAVYSAYWPLARMEYIGLDVSDAVKTVKHVRSLNPKTIEKEAAKKTSGKQPSWDELRRRAIQEGAAATASNSFKLLDSYYTKHVAPRLKDVVDSDKKAKLFPSPEYTDLEMLMQVLKQQGAKPLFVIIPMNGRWYDYTGFPASERQACYQRLAQMIRSKGFALADFSSHEYEDYFLQDPWHLAWKGWVDVDETLDQFYHQDRPAELNLVSAP